VGSTEQTKTGNLIVEGVLRLGQFTTANAPSGADGALYFDTTENKTKIYSSAAWGDLGGGGEPGQLPTYTTAQRDALSPTAGLMIYNTDYDQVQTYTQTAWSGITGNKDLGIECASAMDCASGFCVDSVCCNTSLDNCSGDCEACNLAGNIGYCTVRANLNNIEVTPTCYYCNGVSDTSLAYTGTTGVNCNGVTGFCYSGICKASYCDEDNDTYYAKVLAYCPSGRYSLTLGNDCCDSSATTYPGQTSYFTSINACASWDYNCDGSITKNTNCNTRTVAGCNCTCGMYGGTCSPSSPQLYANNYGCTNMTVGDNCRYEYSVASCGTAHGYGSMGGGGSCSCSGSGGFTFTGVTKSSVSMTCGCI